ncbi:MAG: methyl-accepting chemotaxis protein [Planctomycetota bacterium]|jgi:methyl-accepting chemotaxis protein
MKKMKLSTKLLMAFLAVGVLPAAIIGFMALNKASTALEQQSYDQLIGMRDGKTGQIESFFHERQGDMGVLMETAGTLRTEAFAKLEAIQKIKKAQILDYFNTLKGELHILKGDPYVQAALTEFETAFEASGDKVDTAEWQAVAEKYDTRMKDIMNDNGWYDLFLIHTDGEIVYTACRESDLGMTIPDSSLKTSSIGQAFTKAQSMGAQDIAIGDFAPYAPSQGAPAAFMMGQMRNDEGALVGYAALQVPIDKVNKIMLLRDGMGKTGESYLVGDDGLMRSDSYLDPAGHSVAAAFKNNAIVDTQAIREALAGRQGQKVIADYNGNPVLSCWDPIDLGSGVRWAMMSEIDVAEAFSPVDENGNEYYVKYIQQYGYYDLFLMNPDGYCFYSACREADYQTNLVNGKYSSSGLGKLTRQVLSSKQFGLADFEPYAPSNGEPAAFIAQPVIHNGDVELVVALQLSLDAINGIMQQRAGMGETGETYLVGQDKLMRSDSFLDPTGHSVKASFAGTVAQNGCDTEASQEALSGKTNAKIIMDYNGNPVLSAYAPVTVGDTKWALLAEIDKAEAFAAKNAIVWMMTVILIVSVVAVATLAIFITRSITGPINRIIAGLTEGSEQVSSASGQVSSSSQSLAEGATEQAAGLEETSSSLEEMASMTKQNADNAQQANTLASDARKAADTGSKSMGKMNEAIEEIQKSSDETAKIIKVIDEIAFQTNLLALNAAVEAARAGEAGKGFAVVAEEVRNLAMRSAEAAKNTSEMIEESVKNAKNGVDIAAEVGKVLEEIVGGIGKTSELVGEIAAASQEQSQGIDQVNTAVNQMDKVTQQNAANAEESASASEELSAQAEQMNQIVGELVTLVGGSAAQTTGNSWRGKRSKSKKSSIENKLGSSHSAFHQIADGWKSKKTGKSAVKATAHQPSAKNSAEQAIPLDDSSNDLKDFNS